MTDTRTLEDYPPVKQVIIIRRDLRMRRGKEIAQGAHAAMEWMRQAVIGCYTSDLVQDEPPAVEVRFKVYLSRAEALWLEGNYRKVVCQLDTAEQLLDLYELARLSDIQAHLVYDEGATEFHGARTLTALAIGPDYSDRIDPLTKDLSLY